MSRSLVRTLPVAVVSSAKLLASLTAVGASFTPIEARVSVEVLVSRPSVTRTVITGKAPPLLTGE